jgi:hypothetical protein
MNVFCLTPWLQGKNLSIGIFAKGKESIQA